MTDFDFGERAAAKIGARNDREGSSMSDDIHLISPADYNAAAALIAALLALAGPRRTRVLAGVLYGMWLSRAHGRAMERIGEGALEAAKRGGKLHERHEKRLDEIEDVLGEMLFKVAWLRKADGDAVRATTDAKAVVTRALAR